MTRPMLCEKVSHGGVSLGDCGESVMVLDDGEICEG